MKEDQTSANQMQLPSVLCGWLVLGATLGGCHWTHDGGHPHAAANHVSAAAAGASIDVENIEAQLFDDPVQEKRFIFPVKFVCGEADIEDPLTPAFYKTVINVLNPSHQFSRRIQWWFVTLDQTVQGAVAVVPETGSLVMDCDFILRNLDGLNHDLSGLVEGWVLLEEEDDRNFFRVSAVYSTLHKQRHDLPDLLPVRTNAGYCELDEEQGLLVTIRNQGEAPAEASVTTVTFDDGGAVTRPTPALAPGDETVLPAIPTPDIGEGALNFTIDADSTTALLEVNELNNRARGVCVFVD